MNAHKDEIITAMGVLVLVIGAAAGAYWMLGMSVVALLIIAVFHRARLRRSPLLTMGLAAVVAFIVAYSSS